uniref:HDC00113 n=1 Tax=Drosophila melanogaster TaxID=7227 RepID=Q6II04_DROME|nr:TPA_inf: HDC00113 [Drosophila melanogaster]
MSVVSLVRIIAETSGCNSSCCPSAVLSNSVTLLSMFSARTLLHLVSATNLARRTTRLDLLSPSAHLPLPQSHPPIPNSESNYDCDDRSLYKSTNVSRWNARRLPGLSLVIC